MTPNDSFGTNPDSPPDIKEILDFLEAKISFELVKCENETRTINDYHHIKYASDNTLTFADSHTNINLIKSSGADLLITNCSVQNNKINCIVFCENPRLAFTLITNNWFEKRNSQKYIHPAAIVSNKSTIGQGTKIGPFVYIGPDVSIGNRCEILSHTTIGNWGFGFSRDYRGKLHRNPHKGGVDIGDDVRVGSNNAIDSGSFEPTLIGDGTKTDNFVHIAHNDIIGKDVLLTVGCMLSGSCEIGDGCYLHPHVSVGNHVHVQEGSEIGANSTVLDDIPAYSKAVGSPAKVVGDSRYS